ncbi:2-polyprenylphenol 6-hydroxylase [Skermanella sp. TT6]|uniref:2-polyprenylphenol 6-hydroxylase n=1 Tax=Skermanella cutis TaxID=2775420 RepID=A0ABX7B6H3_9PROT|nr:2-polyprenylphenol 6-hydroxylase [Skermanella sp. TT6]QQP89708.1 2-polyprenylphenol 6-hydroxylase [Skermanella sp. TT6]
MIRTIRNLVRLVVIMRTLGRHDALFPHELRDVAPGIAGFARLFSAKGVPGRPGQRIAAALRDLGPSFIKLGQILSTRSDLVGEAIAADLAELQDKLPPFPPSEARRIIEAELGRPLEEIYESFDETPVAAASIAQVHFAVVATRRDRDGNHELDAGDPRSREVAVKVLRPGIELAFRQDLDLFRWLSELALRIQPRFKRLRPGEVVQIFADTVRMEMDLRMEASAASELADNFRGDTAFNVPRVDWDRTSQRVLTLERIRGIKVDEVDKIRAVGFDPDDVLAQASSSFFNQVFRDGFFHADLHPGNLFVNEDGHIAPVDFGIMGRLDRATRYYLADMLLGFLNGDYRRVAEVHFQAGYVPAHQNIETFTQACRAIGEPLLNKPLHEISIGRLLAQLLSVTEQFEMETQPQLLLLQKSMLTAEGVGRALNPDINMWELARPLIEDWMRENRGPEARMVDELEGVLNALRTLPRVMREAERATRMINENGLPLHPATIEILLEGFVRKRRRTVWTLWTVTMAVALAALAVVT